MLPQFLITVLLAISISTHVCYSSSVYEVLRSNGLPMGLLPNGVNDFRFDGDGKFIAFLDRECNAKYESELHYDRNVSGFLSYGQIANLSGISAQDLFLWFPVKEIRVDVPSSGLIYFDVGVVSKQFSLSMFETPRDCTAVPPPDVVDGGFIARIASKVLPPCQLVLLNEISKMRKIFINMQFCKWHNPSKGTRNLGRRE